MTRLFVLKILWNNFNLKTCLATDLSKVESTPSPNIFTPFVGLITEVVVSKDENLRSFIKNLHSVGLLTKIVVLNNSY